MPGCIEILNSLYSQAEEAGGDSVCPSAEVREKIENVCRCPSNRAAVRLVIACLLAKIEKPEVDPSKPYTEIGTPDCFSGRAYDEQYVTSFVVEKDLPCNTTTAFLTPALRNIDTPLSEITQIVGRPRQVYADAISILQSVQQGTIEAELALIETLRQLIALREERRAALEGKIRELTMLAGDLLLSSEETVSLIKQHLACKHSSRLPVLIVAAAYRAVKSLTGETTKPLCAHTAADRQTGSLGDVQICLVNDDNVRTAYEMKTRKVTKDDIDHAIHKITEWGESIDNYIFVTTEDIDENVHKYAKGMYEQLGQREIAVLDCIGFVRHFLHFFHRHRRAFLDEYQKLLLAEPESAVRHELKEVFLDLRRVAESRQ